jgi:hypothetical protein
MHKLNTTEVGYQRFTTPRHLPFPQTPFWYVSVAAAHES